MEHKTPPRELAEAVLDALQPQSWERMSLLVTGGFAVTQVLDRLPVALQEELAGEGDNPVLTRRVALDKLTWTLDDLIQAGKVKRSRARLKNSLVDVYRRRWRT